MERCFYEVMPCDVGVWSQEMEKKERDCEEVESGSLLQSMIPLLASVAHVAP